METTSGSLLTFLLNSAWQIPVAAGVAALTCRLIGRGPARYCHTVWIAALAMAVALPVASIGGKKQSPTSQWTTAVRAPHATSTAPAPRTRVGPSPGAPSQTPAPISRSVSVTETTAKLLAAAYLLFVLLRLFGLMRGALRTAQLRRTAEPIAVPEQLDRVRRRCEEAFGLTGVRLLFSGEIPGPATVGHAVLLPEPLLTEQSEDVLVTAIGHEMAHIARGDFAFNILFELLSISVSFQPAAWLIRRGIARTREIACDELVTARLIDARAYAEAMVKLASSVTVFPQAGYTLGVFGGNMLEDRVRRLVERRPVPLRGSRLALVAGLAALTVCAVVVSGLAFTAHAQGFASGVIKEGQAAYQRGDYQEAVARFTKAIEMDPANVAAKLLLGDALLVQYVPFDPTKSQMGAAAQRQFLDVLARDAGNRHALHGMLTLAVTRGHYAEEGEWARKAIEADSGDKLAYYTAGFVDWGMASPDYQSARLAAGMRRETGGMIPDAGLRESVRTKHLTQVEDGLRMFETAQQLDPDYADAMEYMGLLYGMEAGIVDNEAESAELAAQAKRWDGKARDARFRRGQNPLPPVSVTDFSPPPPPPPPPDPPPGWHGTLPPPPLVGRMPAMPEVAKVRESGLVRLSIGIAKDGTVQRVDVVEGPPRLVPPVVDGVRKLVFQQTMVGGKPVEVTTMFTIRIVGR